MALSYTVAFVGGLVSFLAPCVLPLIPGYLAYLAGTSATGERPSRAQTFANAAFFVLGFSSVFAALGVLLNTLLESVAYDVQEWLSRIGGLLIIFFGFYLTGLIHIAFLDREHKITVRRSFGSRYLTSFVFGAAFAAGWTPCVGAALGAILGLAASQPGTAFGLLLAYAAGFGMPFLVVGLFAGEVGAWLGKFARVVHYINIVFGLLLIALGVLIFTQQLYLVANFDLLNSVLLEM